MRRLIWKVGNSTLVADLSDTGVWTCDDAMIQAALRGHAERRLPEIRPHEGDPLDILFEECRKSFSADEAIPAKPGNVPDGVKP